MNSRQLVSETGLVLVEFKLIVLAAACCLSFLILNSADKLVAQQPVIWNTNPQLHVPSLQSPSGLLPQGSQVPAVKQARPVAMNQPELLPPVVLTAPPQNFVHGTFVPGNGAAAVNGPVLSQSSKPLSEPAGKSLAAPARPSLNRVPAIPQRALEPSQVADEINSIRQQLGGGLAQQFSEMAKHWQDSDRIDGSNSAAGPGWEEMIEKGFKNEIDRLANDPIQRKLSPSSITFPATNMIPPPPSYVAAIAVPNQNRSPGEQLRVAAEALEQMAGQFETTGLYEEADQVRAQAQRFWLKSRQYPSNQSTR